MSFWQRFAIKSSARMRCKSGSGPVAGRNHAQHKPSNTNSRMRSTKSRLGGRDDGVSSFDSLIITRRAVCLALARLKGHSWAAPPPTKSKTETRNRKNLEDANQTRGRSHLRRNYCVVSLSATTLPFLAFPYRIDATDSACYSGKFKYLAKVSKLCAAAPFQRALTRPEPCDSRKALATSVSTA